MKDSVKGLKRTTALVLTVTMGLFSLAPVLQAATFQLPAGTDVKVKFVTTADISSADVVPGVTLAIELAEPIMVGDRVLVEKGASGTAIVKEAKKAGAPGKPGMITVEFQKLEPKGAFKTTDGSDIALEGSVTRAGKGKKTLAFITIVGIFFIKGGQGVIDVDQVYNAKVAETVVLTDQ